MADVSKIKLPDNSEYNVKDSRIPGVTSSVTSGDANVVTSGGVYTALGDYLPLAGGTLTGTLIISTETGGTPTLALQRGTSSDSYVDHKIKSSSGALKFFRCVNGNDSALLSLTVSGLFPDNGTLTGDVSSLTLGTSSNKWGNLYTDDADISGDATVAGDVVVTGSVSASNIPTYYTGSSAPSSSLGQDGDIYLQVSS